MTLDEMITIFDKYYEAECSRFDRVKSKLSNRSDIHGLLLLDTLDPDDTCAITHCGHGELWLSFDLSVLLKNITKEQVIDLIRCNIGYDNSCAEFVVYV